MPTTDAPTLIYVYDPLCGWCYAAAPLIAAAASIPGLRIELYGGGLLRSQPISPAMRQHIVASDRRIGQLSGQPFGDAYLNGLLHDPAAVLDSRPPIAAVMLADEMSGTGLALLQKIQRAHYVEGRRVSDPSVLADLAVELGLTGFAARLADFPAERLAAHLHTAHDWLARAGANGFPTLIWQHGGALEAPDVLDISPFLGRPEEWKNTLFRLFLEAGRRTSA